MKMQYETPMLVEVGSFSAETLGIRGGGLDVISDFGLA